MKRTRREKPTRRSKYPSFRDLKAFGIWAPPMKSNKAVVPMPDNHERHSNDIFLQHGEWIAAQGRQLIRAHRAKDEKAIEVSWFYLADNLQKVLLRHLNLHVTEPNSSTSESFAGLGFWFDGIACRAPEISNGRVHVRSRIAWVINNEGWHYDPFEFELELCPKSGDFVSYVFRFGDSRPRSEKTTPCDETCLPKGGWAFEFSKSRR
jgi:hypothetical protein